MPEQARLLFSTGFEDGVAVGPPVATRTQWRQDLTGDDRGFDADRQPWGDPSDAFFFLIPAGVDPSGYVSTSIGEVPGPHGTPTRALEMRVEREAAFDEFDGRVRSQYVMHVPESVREGYLSYWLWLQPDLDAVMEAGGGGTWRFVLEFRNDSGSGSDYRTYLTIDRREGEGPLRWRTTGQWLEPGERNDWVETSTHPVPTGRWFRLEVHWLGDPVAGALDVAVDGEVILEHHGRTEGSEPLTALHLFKVYTGAESLERGPAYQRIDDVEIWSSPPPSSSLADGTP